MKSLLVLAFSFVSAGLLGFSSPALAEDDPALAAIDAFIAEAKVDKASSGWKTRLSKPPQVEFAKDKSYFWVLETDAGLLRFKLMPEVAPLHVSSTIYLTRLGFYDGTVFHRVIKGFMAQGGDPLGSGRGGPGYKYAGEFPKDAPRHDRPGLLSMANAGPGTDGSQFFITFVPTPHLNGKHTIFGGLSGSKGALEKLEAVGTRSGQPTERLTIKKATISVP